MSGSGKSVALHALEDAGYYCVDNLPPELLLPFVALEQKSQRAARGHRHGRAQRHLAAAGAGAAARNCAASGVRGPARCSSTPPPTRWCGASRKRGAAIRCPATAPTPKHSDPAQDRQHALVDAIELERELLADLREQAHVIDTSVIRPSQLQAHVKSLLSAPISQLTLVFESFAFKRGIPVDADYVFDVRMLPNPALRAGAARPDRAATQPVIAFLQAARRRGADVQPHRAVPRTTGSSRWRATTAAMSPWRSAAPAASTGRCSWSSSWPPPSASAGSRSSATASSMPVEGARALGLRAANRPASKAYVASKRRTGAGSPSRGRSSAPNQPPCG